MRAEEIFALGLGLTPPWKVMNQRLDTEHTPSKLHLEIGADRGALYPCPECGAACKAHDFKEYTWRLLNFFQHHCYLLRLDYRGSIALNTESDECKPLGLWKAVALLCFLSKWS